MKRPLLPGKILSNSYHPPHGPAPPKEEVLARGPEDVKNTVNRWKPFNRSESAADRLNSLYPMMLRMRVAARADGVGED